MTPRRRGGVEAVGVEDAVLCEAVVEEVDVARAEHDVVGAGAAHHGLMIVVGQGVFQRELIEDGCIALVHVEERHRRAHAFFRKPGESRDHVRVEIGETAAWIVRRRVLDTAIGLLPHLVETVNGVLGIGVVGEPVALSILRGLLVRSVRQARYI